VLIIQIALGIVLAVLILAYWDVILALGFVLVAVAIALVGVGVAIYLAAENPAVATAIAVGAVLVGGAAYWESKRKYEKPAPLPETGEAPPKGVEVALSWRSLNTGSRVAIAVWLLCVSLLLLSGYLLL